MEGHALVPESLLAGAESLEVGGSLGHDLVVKLKFDSVLFGAVDGGVKKDFGTKVGSRGR